MQQSLLSTYQLKSTWFLFQVIMEVGKTYIVHQQYEHGTHLYGVLYFCLVLMFIVKCSYEQLYFL